MLKKKDLVKEFELVVKQEIIEHNNSITANNIAMNKLRDKIEEVNTKCSSVSLRSKNDVIYFVILFVINSCFIIVIPNEMRDLAKRK